MSISFRSPKSQASKAVSERVSLGVPRHENKYDGKIHSVGSARIFEQALSGCAEFVQVNKLGDLKSLTVEIAQAYLTERQESGLSQKTLDADRQALQCHLQQPLERVRSEKAGHLSTRSYTQVQINVIASNQHGNNSLATQIAHSAGLRAHELITILPVSERAASTHREWSGDRFTGRSGVRYTVVGKGGLAREVIVPRDLAARLEATRFAGGAVSVTDRGVCYLKNFDIGSGKNWSTSFSRVSTSQLGWSNGGHGLRHSYAQEHMGELQGAGFTFKHALAIVAQELGHFSPQTTEAYLR